MTRPEDENLRPLLFSLAYRMLGSVAEAEDVVQETLLRMHLAGHDIESREAYATTVAIRRCIDQLRSAQVRRERYVGAWLPEPIVGTDEPGPAEQAETADSISMAMLVVLETLTPSERAAFLLREVFELNYADIAKTLRRSPESCRQLVSRARARVDERAPRFEASRRERDELAARFLDACRSGDLQALTELLAADAVFTGDGGGNVPPGTAISKPVLGRTAVARLLMAFHRRGSTLTLQPATVNGQPGCRVLAPDARLVAVLSFDIIDGAIQTVRSILNPDKLRHLGPTANLERIFRRHP